MNTQGGTFTYTASLGVDGASVGYFNSSNAWVDQGPVEYTATAITPPAGVTVRVTHADSGEPVTVRRQAEFGITGGGAVVHSDELGFAGNGYVGFPPNGGLVQLEDVDGLSGGKRTLRVRYASGYTDSVTAQLLVNGAAHKLAFAPTGGWSQYGLVSVQVSMLAGKTNTVMILTNGQGAGNIDEVQTY